MEHNKYFKDYFLFHEESLDKGLTKIDKDLGLVNYFKFCFMKHLEKENRYRKLNKDIFDHMKNDKTLEKSQTRIKYQKKTVKATLNAYRGHKTTNVAKLADRDIQNFLGN